MNALSSEKNHDTGVILGHPTPTTTVALAVTRAALNITTTQALNKRLPKSKRLSRRNITFIKTLALRQIFSLSISHFRGVEVEIPYSNTVFHSITVILFLTTVLMRKEIDMPPGPHQGPPSSSTTLAFAQPNIHAAAILLVAPLTIAQAPHMRYSNRDNAGNGNARHPGAFRRN